MPRSLRGRLIALLILLLGAVIAAGAMMVGLFRQSATAQAGQAAAEIGRACDAIGRAYRAYSAGSQNPSVGRVLRRDLTAVVAAALRDRRGIEGGIWREDSGSLAYAFPTYQGLGPKTDVPEAELPRIEAVNREARAGNREADRSYPASSQILLLTACPLPVAGLTAWAMTRVFTFAGGSYRLLMAGLGVLVAAMLAAFVFVTRLTMTWSRHIAHIETALQAHDIAGLPRLPATGERELDRVVRALNEAGRRVAEARRRADELARRVATGERLAAIGRVAAGLAHEIRNPIAAMRLRAENAIVGDLDRKNQALSAILEQIARLDALVRRLLSVTERETLNCGPVDLVPFLEACVAAHAGFARARHVALQCAAASGTADFDAELMRRALDNLVLNAIEAAPRGTAVVVMAKQDGARLVISVRDEGAGPPPGIRDELFEPFVTGRADGTGLGLSIVRGVAAAHGGNVRLASQGAGTVFEIVVPCARS